MVEGPDVMDGGGADVVTTAPGAAWAARTPASAPEAGTSAGETDGAAG